jgi:carbon starvation protein CstA
MKQKDDEIVRKKFLTRQTRQIIAIAISMFLVLLCAVLYKRPVSGIRLSREALSAAQAIVIAAFLGFTSVNWRCPACGKFLGHDLHRETCRKCGVRLR